MKGLVVGEPRLVSPQQGCMSAASISLGPCGSFARPLAGFGNPTAFVILPGCKIVREHVSPTRSGRKRRESFVALSTVPAQFGTTKVVRRGAGGGPARERK